MSVLLSGTRWRASFVEAAGIYFDRAIIRELLLIPWCSVPVGFYNEMEPGHTLAMQGKPIGNAWLSRPFRSQFMAGGKAFGTG
jgi:hypothetical protein